MFRQFHQRALTVLSELNEQHETRVQQPYMKVRRPLQLIVDFPLRQRFHCPLAFNLSCAVDLKFRLAGAIALNMGRISGCAILREEIGKSRGCTHCRASCPAEPARNDNQTEGKKRKYVDSMPGSACESRRNCRAGILSAFSELFARPLHGAESILGPIPYSHSHSQDVLVPD